MEEGRKAAKYEKDSPLWPYYTKTSKKRRKPKQVGEEVAFPLAVWL